MNDESIALVRQILKSAKITEGHVDSVVSRMGLSATKLLTLRHLEQSPEAVSLGTLARCMVFAKSNATQLIDHLERKGLVRRLPNPEDRRCVSVSLTTKGRTTMASGSEAVRPLADRIASLYTAEERAQFLEYLLRLGESLT